MARSLITQDLADRSYHGPDETIDDALIQIDFEKAYRGKEQHFKIALLEARDYVGDLLARTWTRLGPNDFSYAGFGLALLASDREVHGEHQETIRDCFGWREIMFPADSPALQTFEIHNCRGDT